MLLGKTEDLLGMSALLHRHQYPRSTTIYACFELHNYCEENGESIREECVSQAVAYDSDFQPAATPTRDTSEVIGKRVRRVLTSFFGP